jgi:cell division protein FtsW
MFVGVLFGALAFKFGVRGGTMVSRINDYIAFVQGEKEPQFQAKHGYIAIATGGILGKGPGQSDQRNILPNPFADFIFAILIEEYGMVGGIVVVALYLLLLHRGMKAAYNSERAFGGLLSAGLCFDTVCQAMINMGVVVGLGPITGQPLPLISMGGTSMVFTGLAMGIVLSVSRGENDEAWLEKSGDGVKVKEPKNMATAKAA